ncbi:MAG TPA: ABC transporter ATP-binding protein [Candidatus Limnocylindrales bacterium]
MSGLADSPVIELQGLTKRYGRTLALDGLSLRVGRGEVFGFLGPNGAGKTTAVKLLLGLARPSGGQGRVLGEALGALEARRHIGYLPELFRYQSWLRAREVLALHCRLAGLSRSRWDGAIEGALERAGIADRADDIVGTFSKGMQQRLGLGVALLGEPTLMVLDEPTSALDPIGRSDVRTIIRDLRDRGTTVFLNSHLLTEVERVCDRVAIVDHGRVIAAGPLDELLGGPSVRIRADGLDAARLALLGERFGRPVADGDELTFQPLEPDRVPELVSAIVGLGGRIRAVQPGRETLEERFVELVQAAGTSATPPEAA